MWLLLFPVLALAGCSSKKDDPAPLPGRWTLSTMHVVEKDANGQLLQDYTLTGKSGDYLLLTDVLFQEYSNSQLNFEMPYTRAVNILTLKALVEHLNQTREIRELSASKLVLSYDRAAIVQGQSAKIEATYTR
ncbi:hypothetical protein SAMN02745146_3325 [Hymenobacter daecheongensis DSM 21074]|uniref:Lipocalin-like domain-containing protein n=2 Tax=Hymenobacter daecheongensis TaxID=496053 RepID=A0A1M6JYV2_9BACT|nr:hypothetical protein SAMN02745146_3325 [Hymenobacter daecheongensis DSM 21074]